LVEQLCLLGKTNGAHMPSDLTCQPLDLYLCFLEAEEAMKMRLSPVARAGASAVMTAAGQDRGRARQS
jgi:hypothetical protein